MRNQLVSRAAGILKRHEGVKDKPYMCTAGKLTIGVGRNLTDVGLSQDEIEYLLNNDINKTIAFLKKSYPWFDGLNDARKLAMIDLGFNLGQGRLAGFTKALVAMAQGRYVDAANEFLDSNYAKQVKSRAKTVANAIATGVWDGYAS